MPRHIWTEADLARYQARTKQPHPQQALSPWERVALTLPWPPSVNHYWRPVGSRLLLTDAGKAYKRTVAQAVLRTWPRAIPRPLHGHLGVTLTYHRSDQQRYDVDNFAKSLLDALTHAGVWLDDSQVDALHLLRGALAEVAHVVVTIQQLRQAEKA